MIVECQNCNSKFDVKDHLIPLHGRVVQCGFCNFKWHQVPLVNLNLKKNINQRIATTNKKTQVKQIGVFS